MPKKKTKTSTSDNSIICDNCNTAITDSGFLSGVIYVSGKEYSYVLCKPCVHAVPGFKAGKATEERKKFWKDFSKQLVKKKK